MEIIAQIIGIVAMLVNILSFQCKSNRKLFIMIGVGCLLFSINFLLLGAYVSAIYNIIHILRSCLATSKKFTGKPYFYLLCLLYTVAAVVAYDNLWSIVLFIAQIVQTYAMWFKDGAFIRKSQIYFISPAWLVNNILVSSIGGILCEGFIILSAIVSFIRYKKTGFEK